MTTTSNYLADLNGKEISTSGTIVSPRRNELNLIAGSNVTISGADNAALNRTDITISTTPGTVGSGSETGQILAWSGSAWVAGRTVSKAAIAAGVASGLIIHNPTAAALGAPQYSPAFTLQGEGWETTGGTRREVYARAQVRGIQGASVDTQWVVSLGNAAEGTAPDAASLTDALTLTASRLTLPGDVLIANGFGYFCDSSPTGTPIRIAAVNSTEDVFLGDANNGTSLTSQVKTGGSFTWTIGVGTELTLSNSTLNAQDNNFVTTGSLYAGSATTLGEPAGTISAVQTGSDGRRGVISYQHSADAVPPQISGWKSRGTRSSLAAVISSDQLAVFRGYGYAGATGGWAVRAAMRAVVDGAVVDGATPTLPTSWQWLTGTTVETLRITLASTGSQTHNCDTGGGYLWQVNAVEQARVVLDTLDLHNGTNTNFSIKGNAESMIGLNIAAAGVRNIALFNDGSAGMQSMDGGVYIANAVVVPTGNPSGGGYFYEEGGSLKYRGSSGTITTLGAA